MLLAAHKFAIGKVIIKRKELLCNLRVFCHDEVGLYVRKTFVLAHFQSSLFFGGYHKRELDILQNFQAPT